MSKPRSRLFDYKERVFRTVYGGYTTEIHFGRQAKHLPDQPDYDRNKSPITIDFRTLQNLLEHKAGTGTPYKTRNGQLREKLDFEIFIGFYRDEKTGRLWETTQATIHYSKYGAHIVPAIPSNFPNLKSDLK